MRKEYIQQKKYKKFEMKECNWWELFRTDATVKNHLRANCKFPLATTSQRGTTPARY